MLTYLLFCGFILGIECCEIRSMVKSLAEIPFEFKLSRSDIVGFEMKENLVFNGKDEQKELLIKADDCSVKPWKMETFKRNPEGTLELAKEAMVKFDGKGVMDIKIKEDLQPWIGARVGVYCAESWFCG
uniref:Uncharacterized protein n=2 Tax=Meloidogyne enterolobii TaxID=390850 RepID=A0A6V7URS8_MELEN|nr:unnamed protein product [Meloidogyne enterolobii]